MKRLENESYEAYKKRLKAFQKQLKNKAKGTLIHNSYVPFVKEKDVERFGFTKALRNAKGYDKHLKERAKK